MFVSACLRQKETDRCRFRETERGHTKSLREGGKRGGSGQRRERERERERDRQTDRETERETETDRQGHVQLICCSTIITSHKSSK